MSKVFGCCANLWCFLVLFCLCYFLETITFTYLVSAVQSIERQFEIPSRMSGGLVAASDIGYVITVVVLAYLGSRGNRARWIGGGCLTIALASLLVALPTFVYPYNSAVHDEPALLKGIFEPITPEIEQDPQLFKQSMWGERMFGAHWCFDMLAPKRPARVGTSIATTTITPLTTDWGPESGFDQDGDEIDTGMAKVSNLMKRVATDLEAQANETIERMKSDISNAVVDFMFFDAPYQQFANRLYNITNDQEFLDLMNRTGKLGEGKFMPLTREQVRTPHNLMNSWMGLKFPDYIRTYLNDTGYRMLNNTHNLTKRQAPHLKLANDPRQKLRSTMFSWTEELIMGCIVGENIYNDFIANLSSVINPISKRLVMVAGLPFGYCRNASMLVKGKMKLAECKHQLAGNSGNNGAFAMVFIGIMFIGVGHSMPWTLGMPMIDDNVKKAKTPYYFAGVFFVRIMGPVVGFMLGAICSKLYVTLEKPNITPLDPRWIGAWWLGFLVVFATLTIPSIVLMFFPKFQTKQSVKNTRTPQQIKNGDASLIEESAQNKYHFEDPSVQANKKTGLKKELIGFGMSLAVVLRCPVYTGSLIGRLFDAFAFKGYFVFKGKYFENHYGLTQFKSAIYMGVMGVVGFAGGVVIGSLLMRKAKLEGRKAAAYVGLCSLISAILAIAQMFLGCHSVVNQIGREGMDNGNATHPIWPTCDGCNCDAAGLYPVCDTNGTAFYSPCHAGCTNFTSAVSSLDVNFAFNNCSCVKGDIQKVSRDWCKDDCGTPLTIYLVISTISGIIGGSSVIPGVLIVLRSVPKEHRSVALGFSGFIVSLISTFPSPPVYGLIIDTACIVWNSACGGGKGSCQIYDPLLLRQRIYIFHGALRCLALLFDIWVWYYAKDLKLMEEDEDEKSEDRPNAPPFSPSFAHELEDEMKGLQADGSDVLARRLSM